MARFVYAIVKGYVEKYPDSTYSQLKEAFPDDWGKPGFGVVIEDINKGKAKDNLEKLKEDKDPIWRFHTNRSTPEKGVILLHDGSQIVVSNQWNFDGNFKEFLKHISKKYSGEFNIYVH